MTQIDRYGLPLSTSFAEAAEWYGVSVDAVLGFEGGIIEAVDRALEIDPGFALAHIHKARALQVEGRMSEALESKRAAQFLAGRATAEEQSQIAALSRTIDGDGPAAIASIKEHLGDYPRSALLLAQVVFDASDCGGTVTIDRA